MTTVIDYYLTPVSPFTYLAGDRLERIAARHGATVRYLPVDLPRVFAATGGLPLGQRAPARQAYRLQELARGREMTGMPLNLHPKHFPTDAKPAAIAIAAAAAAGADAGALARHLLAACWVHEKDIADPAVIGDAIAAAGIDAAALDPGAGAAAVEANTDAAIARGVFGSPFYAVGDELFWGHDRLDALDWHLAGRPSPAGKV